jgi:hypothetical protein
LFVSSEAGVCPALSLQNVMWLSMDTGPMTGLTTLGGEACEIVVVSNK